MADTTNTTSTPTPAEVTTARCAACTRSVVAEPVPSVRSATLSTPPTGFLFPAATYLLRVPASRRNTHPR